MSDYDDLIGSGDGFDNAGGVFDANEHDTTMRKSKTRMNVL